MACNEHDGSEDFQGNFVSACGELKEATQRFVDEADDLLWEPKQTVDGTELLGALAWMMMAAGMIVQLVLEDEK